MLPVQLLRRLARPERRLRQHRLLTPPILFSIERAIEYIDNDELVEVTPNHLRFRKRILDANDRRKATKRAKAVGLAQV